MGECSSTCPDISLQHLKLIFTIYNCLMAYCTWAKYMDCSVCSLTGNFLTRSYKCKTGPASRFFMSGGRRSWTCLLQCFSWADCQIESRWLLVTFPSIARKFNMIWDCLITCKRDVKSNHEISIITHLNMEIWSKNMLNKFTVKNPLSQVLTDLENSMSKKNP